MYQSTNDEDIYRYNPGEKYEFRYWSERMNVSEEKIREAVKKVGTSIKAIYEYLKKIKALSSSF